MVIKQIESKIKELAEERMKDIDHCACEENNVYRAAKIAAEKMAEFLCSVERGQTEADIPIDAIAHLLNLSTTDKKKKEEATQLYLF